MSELKDIEKGIISGETSPVEINQLSGLYALLTSPLAMPPAEQGERRSGVDRRRADRRVTAPGFSVPE